MIRVLDSWNIQFDASVDSCTDEVTELDLQIIVAREEVEALTYIYEKIRIVSHLLCQFCHGHKLMHRLRFALKNLELDCGCGLGCT